jgi:hypothetical protein
MKKISLIVLLSGLSFSNLLNAQNWLELREKGTNFNDVQAAFQKENAGKMRAFKRELIEEAGTKAAKSPKFEKEMEGMIQYHRWAQFVAPRVSEANGDMTAMSEGMFRAISRKNREISTRAANWTLVGPTNTPTNGGNGRINTIRVSPSNPSTLFACSPAGGLWKSTNGGTSWTAISHSIAAVGATDIAFHPTDPNTLFLATGDGDAADVFTLGLYKSTDGGNTWNPTSLIFNLSDNKTLSKILIDPNNPYNMVAGGRAGIYYSNNGGDTWSQSTNAGATIGVRDLEYQPGNPSVVYAGGYSSSAGFWRSADGGATWTKNTTSMATGVQRVAVAVSPLDANIVYTLAAKTSSYGYEGVYHSTDAGLTFTKMSSTPNILGWYNGTSAQSDNIDGQGWYDLCIAIGADINTIYTGGVNIWKSTNGGTSFTKLTSWNATNSSTTYVHADIHDLVYSGTTLYAAADGGVFSSTTNGTSWSDKSSNLSIAQLYGIGLSANNANIIISGHQDNGTTLTSNLTTWSEVNGGDGMLCFVDRTNNSTMFSSIYNGSLYRSTNGGSSFSSIYTVPGGGWVTPWLQDPVTAATLYAGGSNVYRSTNTGTSWSAVSSLTAPSGQRVEFVGLDVAKTNNQVIYGCYDTKSTTTGAWVSSKMVKTTTGGSPWTDISAGLPTTAAILFVHVDVNNANTVYVALASYTGNSVYRSTDGGTNWANISSGLPSIPANCFVTQNGTVGTVYCGTDLGVYLSENGGTTWQSFTNGMPGVPVKDLEIYYPTGKLRAATYGLSIWESNLNTFNQAPSVSITSPTTNSVFTAGSTITINATASDADGTIANVEFYNGTTLLGSDIAAPYTFDWLNIAVGSYVITAKAFDNSGASTTSTSVNITVSVATDAGISAIATPNGIVNTAGVTPSVSLKNFGSNALTSATILYKVDNGTEASFSWTGSLASGATTTVALGAVSGYTVGNHTFTARTSNPNGSIDGNVANDAITTNFTYTTCSNSNEPADNTSSTGTVLAPNSSISTQIGTSSDVDYYKLTTTNAAPKLQLSLTNLPANYNLYLYTSRNNGTIGNLITISTNTGTTNETITYNTPTTGRLYYVVVQGSGGAFSNTQCYTLTANASSTNFIRPFENTAKNREGGISTEVLELFPNPTNADVTIRFNALAEMDFTVQVVDITGKEAIRKIANCTQGNNTINVQTDILAKGIYFVKISNETQTAVAKLVVEK